MPTYQYSCTECGHFFEAVQSFSDDSLTVCPQCEGRLRKVFNAVGVVFKGSGFYRNDSRAGNGNGSSNGSGKSAEKSGEKSGSGDSAASKGSTDGGSGSGSSKSSDSGSAKSSTTASAGASSSGS